MILKKIDDNTYESYGGGDYDLRREVQQAKSLGTAGTVLGAVGAGAAAGVFGGNGLFGGLFGGNNYNHQCMLEKVRDKECEDYVSTLKAMYDGQITWLKDAYATRNNDISEKFSMYNFFQNRFVSMSDRIAQLETEVAVGKAVRPYQDKILADGIALVGQQAANAVAQEAERRCCADNKIVTYLNGTFTPEYVATQVPGATTVTYTQKTVYNPLCGCCGTIGITA